MSANQYWVDTATRHQVFLQRYSAGRSKDAQDALGRIRRDIVGRLADEPTTFRHDRLKTVLAEVDSIMFEMTGIVTDDLKDAMDAFVISEAEFTAKMLEGGAKVDFAMPSDQQLITAAETTAFNVGSDKLTVEQALSQYSLAKRKEIKQMITDGVILGDTTPEISRKLRTTMNNLHKRQIDALVRTSINHISSVAREEIYKENKDILEGYEFVATLDNRTTNICGSLDGQVFPFDRGHPMPPVHWNCRSTTVPKIKKEFDLGSDIHGKRPSKGSSGPKLVNTRETYNSWLKRQSHEFQNEALGIERAKLFRAGTFGMKGFVDPINGRTYTLAELKIKDGMSLN